MLQARDAAVGEGTRPLQHALSQQRSAISYLGDLGEVFILDGCRESSCSRPEALRFLAPDHPGEHVERHHSKADETTISGVLERATGQRHRFLGRSETPGGVGQPGRAPVVHERDARVGRQHLEQSSGILEPLLIVANPREDEGALSMEASAVAERIVAFADERLGLVEAGARGRVVIGIRGNACPKQ